MYYSVLIETSEGRGKNAKRNSITSVDYTDAEIIKNNIIQPYLNGQTFEVEGYILNGSQITRIKIVSSEQRIDDIIETYHQRDSVTGVFCIYTAAGTISSDNEFLKKRYKRFLKSILIEHWSTNDIR